MPSKIRFNYHYFRMFSCVLLMEIIIALFITDSFIRPFVGDALVVILIYLFIRTFIPVEKSKLIIGVLLFSYCVETGQYFDLVSILKLQNNKVARMVIGSTFDVKDFFAYSAGAVLLILPDYLIPVIKRPL